MTPDDTTPTAAAERPRAPRRPPGRQRRAWPARSGSRSPSGPTRSSCCRPSSAATPHPLLRLGYRRGDRMIRGPVSATSDELLELLRLARADEGLAAVLPA